MLVVCGAILPEFKLNSKKKARPNPNKRNRFALNDSILRSAFCILIDTRSAGYPATRSSTSRGKLRHEGIRHDDGGSIAPPPKNKSPSSPTHALPSRRAADDLYGLGKPSSHRQSSLEGVKTFVWLCICDRHA